jgi:hypothetical protein
MASVGSDDGSRDLLVIWALDSPGAAVTIDGYGARVVATLETMNQESLGVSGVVLDGDSLFW